MKNVPAIRFQGYTNDWEDHRVGDYLDESRIRGNTGDAARKITVKLWGKGVVEKNDTGSEHTQYFLRTKGQFIYSTLDFLNSAFGVIPEELDGYESTADLPAFDLQNLNPYFMYYIAIQERFYLKNGLIADGSRKAKRIHAKTFLEMPIISPTEAEQDCIVALLQKIDILISLQQQKLCKLQQLKEAMLYKLFSQHKTDTPEIRFKGFRSSWIKRSFSEITYPAGKKNHENLPYESYSITNEHGFIPQEEQFENGGTMRDADKRMYYIVPPESFAYNPARINVGSIGYQNIGKTVIVSSLYEVFKTTEDVDDRFLWHWFKSQAFTDLILQFQEGGVRLYFYYDKLCKGFIHLPCIEEQTSIGQALDKIDHLITLHQQKTEKLKQIRAAMLNKMFV